MENSGLGKRVQSLGKDPTCFNWTLIMLSLNRVLSLILGSVCFRILLLHPAVLVALRAFYFHLVLHRQAPLPGSIAVKV